MTVFIIRADSTDRKGELPLCYGLCWELGWRDEHHQPCLQGAHNPVAEEKASKWLNPIPKPESVGWVRTPGPAASLGRALSEPQGLCSWPSLATKLTWSEWMYWVNFLNIVRNIPLYYVSWTSGRWFLKTLMASLCFKTFLLNSSI